MRLQDLKDQLMEQLTERWAQVKESNLYVGATEQYQNLSPFVQRLLNYFGIGFVIFILLYIPYSYIESSFNHMEEFNINRQTTRDLLHVKSLSGVIDQIPRDQGSRLRMDVQRILDQMGLADEQKTPLQDLSSLGSQKSNLAKPTLSQQGVIVEIKKLNLNQITELSVSLSNVAYAKMTSLDIKANAEDSRYFDVIYKMVHFSFPVSDDEADTKGTGRGFKSPPRRRFGS